MSTPTVDPADAGVFLVAHRERPEATELATTVSQWFAGHGVPSWMAPEDAEALGLPALAAERPPSDAQLAISLGGDGTILRTVQLLGGSAVPILGVNVGLLGYLSELEPAALTASLERWLAGPERGQWTIEERMMLAVALDRAGAPPGTEPQRWTALNEAVIEKCEAGHTVRLLVSIDGAVFTSYAADGMIVATPTGSTAYSLSARGPVLSPTHRALLMTPVSPHMLFDRSLVLEPSERVGIEVLGHRPAILSVDGQVAADLVPGDVAELSEASAVARFVRFGGRRFHQILKNKFGLADR